RLHVRSRVDGAGTVAHRLGSVLKIRLGSDEGGLALKGHNKPAQGNALGRRRRYTWRSPERAQQQAATIVVSPLQGLTGVWPSTQAVGLGYIVTAFQAEKRRRTCERDF